MRYLVISVTLFTLFINILHLFSQQSIPVFLSSVNNSIAGTTYINYVVNSIDDGGTILIDGNGNDGISNIEIKKYDNNNNLIETIIGGGMVALSYPKPSKKEKTKSQ